MRHLHRACYVATFVAALSGGYACAARGDAVRPAGPAPRAGLPEASPDRDRPASRLPGRDPVLIPAPTASPAVEQGGELEFVPNQVLVQFRPGTSAEERAAARQALGATIAASLTPSGDLELLNIDATVGEAVDRLAGLPAVDFAEPNFIARHDAVPDDPYYTGGLLWGMYGDLTTPANQFGSQAGELWAQNSVGSSTVYVGVIDEGIDFNHPDLAANVWTNPFDPVDGVDNDGNGRIDDIHGWDFDGNNNSVYDGPTDDHGTHVAGTIGARGGNGAGVAGMNWNATMISAKFLNGVTGSGSYANAVLAFDYLIDLKTRHGLNLIVTNNSWSGPSASTSLHQALIRAAKAGILIVAGAANGGADGIGDNNDAIPAYPANYATNVAAGSETAASYDAVISVASLTTTGTRSSFSNYGLTTVDLGAPGSGIYSTLPANTYGSYSGTSMATPHVSGAVALYKSMNPSATAAGIRGAILSQTTATTSMAGITATGGRLNVGGFTALTFTDSTLTAGSSVIKAVHVTELRTRINAVRTGRGVANYAFTDPTLTAGSSVVKAVHITELREALREAYVAAGLTPPSYTDPALAPGGTARVQHITELRTAVIALE